MDQYVHTDESYLAAILEERPEVGLYSGDVPVELVREGKTYRDAGYGDSLGLYDWLRDDRGLVVGVGLTLLDETAPAVQAWPPLSYVRRFTGQDYVEVVFRDHAGETFTMSEQITSTSRVLVSDGGDFMLLLDAVGLTDLDRQALMAETPLPVASSA